MSEAPPDPMRAAQAHMRPERPRRFYRQAGVEETEDGYALVLDGRVARTPGKNRLAHGEPGADGARRARMGRGRARDSIRPTCP